MINQFVSHNMYFDRGISLHLIVNIAYRISCIAYRVYNVRKRNQMPNQKTACEYTKAVIKNYANLRRTTACRSHAV